MCAVSDHNLKLWEYYEVQSLYRSLEIEWLFCIALYALSCSGKLSNKSVPLHVPFFIQI